MIKFLHPETKIRISEGWIPVKNYVQGDVLVQSNGKIKFIQPKGKSIRPNYQGQLKELDWLRGNFKLLPSIEVLNNNKVPETYPNQIFTYTTNWFPTYNKVNFTGNLYSLDFKEDVYLCISFAKTTEYIFIKNY